MPGGRPTDYKPEYCQMIIEHMKQGRSIKSFGSVVNACENTIHSWKEKNPEFLRSIKVGEQHSFAFWERLGIAGAAGKVKNFNAASWIFNMRNRFGWRDNVEINTTQPIEIKFIKDV